MAILEFIGGVLLLILIGVIVGGLFYVITGDAPKRGFSSTQIFLLRVSLLLFFPVSLILYLIFRPAIRPDTEPG